jgi:hypothetical protein
MSSGNEHCCVICNNTYVCGTGALPPPPPRGVTGLWSAEKVPLKAVSEVRGAAVACGEEEAAGRRSALIYPHRSVLCVCLWVSVCGCQFVGVSLRVSVCDVCVCQFVGVSLWVSVVGVSLWVCRAPVCSMCVCAEGWSCYFVCAYVFPLSISVSLSISPSLSCARALTFFSLSISPDAFFLSLSLTHTHSLSLHQKKNQDRTIKLGLHVSPLRKKLNTKKIKSGSRNQTWDPCHQ